MYASVNFPDKIVIPIYLTPDYDGDMFFFLSHHMNKKTLKQMTYPEEIEHILKNTLQSYLQGEMTERHLSQVLKKQLQGNGTKLSVKTVELLPQFTQLQQLLKEVQTSTTKDKKILTYVLKKLADTLLMAL